MEFFGTIEIVINIVGFLYILMIVFSGIYDLCYSYAQRRKSK